MPSTIEELTQLIEKNNIQIAFGLEQQGYIPTVEKMLAEGKNWEDIGKVIGWHGPTAEKWYQMYLDMKFEQNNSLSEPIRYLEKILDNLMSVMQNNLKIQENHKSLIEKYPDDVGLRINSDSITRHYQELSLKTAGYVKAIEILKANIKEENCHLPKIRK